MLSIGRACVSSAKSCPHVLLPKRTISFASNNCVRNHAASKPNFPQLKWTESLKTHRDIGSDMRFRQNGLQRRSFSTSPVSSFSNLSLTEQQTAVLNREISVLKTLITTMKEANAPTSEIETLERSVQQLEELFLLVIVGEFNSGKSSFLNALLGKRYLKEGVTPTTSRIGLLKFGQQETTTPAPGGNIDHIALPVTWLKDLCLVDTPGTNAIMRDHQQITEHFIPRSDLVIFVTSADRAFSESERIFLEHIKQWRKKIVVVITKRDTVETETELEEITRFVTQNFQNSLGISPAAIFSVSSKEALKAKIETGANEEALQENSRWKSSHFADLEKYILQTLNKEERTRLKLENPIGIADHLTAKYIEQLHARAELLKGDLEALGYIEDQIKEFNKEMTHDLDHQKDRIDNMLLNMKERSHRFLEERLRLTQFLELLKSEKIRNDFEKEVVGETSRDIERQIDSLIDWTISKNARLWKSVMERIQLLGRMTVSSSKKEMLEKINVLSFDYNRAALLTSLGGNSLEVMKSFDREKESKKLSSEVRQAIVSTAAIEVGALGIGALLSISLLDLTGLAGLGVIAATGLAILPYKKASIQKALDTKISLLRTSLNDTMKRHFYEELETSTKRIHSAIEPFSRFVSIEQERLKQHDQALQNIQTELLSIREELNKAFSK